MTSTVKNTQEITESLDLFRAARLGLQEAKAGIKVAVETTVTLLKPDSTKKPQKKRRGLSFCLALVLLTFMGLLGAREIIAMSPENKAYCYYCEYEGGRCSCSVDSKGNVRGNCACVAKSSGSLVDEEGGRSSLRVQGSCEGGQDNEAD